MTMNTFNTIALVAFALLLGGCVLLISVGLGVFIWCMLEAS